MGRRGHADELHAQRLVLDDPDRYGGMPQPLTVPIMFVLVALSFKRFMYTLLMLLTFLCLFHGRC